MRVVRIGGALGEVELGSRSGAGRALSRGGACRWSKRRDDARVIVAVGVVFKVGEIVLDTKDWSPRSWKDDHRAGTPDRVNVSASPSEFAKVRACENGARGFQKLGGSRQGRHRTEPASYGYPRLSTIGS